MLQKYIPVFDSGMSVHDDSNTTGGGFAPGEKEMLYKLVFNMKNQLDEVRKHLGLHTDMAHDHYASHALPSAADEVIDMESEEVPSDYVAHTDSVPEQSALPSDSRPLTLDEIEKEAIRVALERNGGNKRKAADQLGISERTIHRKIQDYNL